MIRIPWLELAILIPVIGAMLALFVRDTLRATLVCQIVSAVTLVLSILGWLESYLGRMLFGGVSSDWLGRLVSMSPIRVDELAAPLVPAIALLFFLTALATTRTKVARFPFALILLAESISLTMFACQEPAIVVGLLALSTVPPLFDLLQRQKPVRLYLLHQLLFLGLLLGGWFVREQMTQLPDEAWIIPLMLAVIVRAGFFPFHGWITDLFENASLGMAITAVVPVAGAYAAVRVLFPLVPEWALQWIAGLAMFTAIYAAGMALIQGETRRFFTFLFLSQSSLILVGLDLATPLSLTGALCVWFSVILSMGGLGLTLRALESRYGRQSLRRFHGLYDNAPILAVFFILTGLASVGFPGTLGFISSELLVDGALEANRLIGVLVVIAEAMNGIAIIRVYFILFTGSRNASTLPLLVNGRERLAIITMALLILGGGFFPQPGIASRQKAAEELIHSRDRFHAPADVDSESEFESRHEGGTLGMQDE